MKRLWEHAGGVLWQGDALEWLDGLAPESVDLVIADPPYNIGKAKWDTFPSQEAYLDWTRRWVAAAHRALTPTGTLYVMGFSEILAQIQVAVAEPWTQVRWLVWFYRNKANLKNDWGRSHESVLHLRKAKRFTFNTDDVRIPYNRHTTKYPERSQAETSQYGGKRSGWTPHPKGARPRDVLEVPVLCNGTQEKTAHPTQKPVELIEKLLLASSNPGDLVVDPFGGSGTTAAVAQRHDRRWATCEADPDYAALIRARLTEAAEPTEPTTTRTTRRAKLR